MVDLPEIPDEAVEAYFRGRAEALGYNPDAIRLLLEHTDQREAEPTRAGLAAAYPILAAQDRREIERLRRVLTEIAEYADERREKLDDGTGLAQHALATIGNTASREVSR